MAFYSLNLQYFLPKCGCGIVSKSNHVVGGRGALASCPPAETLFGECVRTPTCLDRVCPFLFNLF